MKISTIALILIGLLAFESHADELQMQDNPPVRYTVVKGDTLWAISKKYLKDPWKWPQIWHMNQAEVKKPHWIYPGNVLVLSMHDGQPQLDLESGQGAIPTVTLSPSIREEAIESEGILPIPANEIHSYATQSLVIDKDGLDHAPKIIEYEDDHMLVATGDVVYASNDDSGTTHWKVVRAGKPILDPETHAILGYAAQYLGEARTVEAGNPQKVDIVSSTEEIQSGDRLLPFNESNEFRYIPHAPSVPIAGLIISAIGVMSEAGQYDSIMINKGAQDGLEKGDVLAIYHQHRDQDHLKVPASRSALCMVYRVFDHVSYALIMDSTHSVSTLDVIRNP